MDSLLTASIGREECTTQNLRTSSPNKAQPITKGRPISDGTTGDSASCFLSSSKSVTTPTSGSQLPVFSSYLLSAVTSHPRLSTRMDFCFCFLYHFSEKRKTCDFSDIVRGLLSFNPCKCLFSPNTLSIIPSSISLFYLFFFFWDFSQKSNDLGSFIFKNEVLKSIDGELCGQTGLVHW